MPLLIDYIAGFCPVQAEGCFDRHEFYFKSRGERWRVHIDGREFRTEPYGTFPEAGYMEESLARQLIEQTYEQWHKEHCDCRCVFLIERRDGSEPPLSFCSARCRTEWALRQPEGVDLGEMYCYAMAQAEDCDLSLGCAGCHQPFPQATP